MKDFEKDCYILLKWGSLKGYNFSDEFYDKNTDLVLELNNIWNEIYENHCSATGGSEEVHKNKELKNKLCNILEKFFNLNIEISNNWDNTIYTNFEDIKNYILNYGEGN